MVIIIKKEDILKAVEKVDVVAAMEEGFIQYSKGNTVVPPVGELLFEEPRGEAHIKYGYIKKDDFYCIKIASGFYDNPKLGISSSQGLMLLFDQKTGQPAAVLLDEGVLTDIRTAAAGALAARYFAPRDPESIGIIGTGIQARLQLEFLLKQTDCRSVWIWGRNEENSKHFKEEMGKGVEIHIARSPSEVAQNTRLIVTTTPSETPLLFADDIRPGTHITAIGSDTSHKQELESALLQKADILIADSKSQSKSRGEIFRAVKDGLIDEEKAVELGNAILNPDLRRKKEDQISIADLTGVAVQDIMIATAVYKNFINN
ncbi:ornithine cyclodeaminase family protein [Leptobacterium flavescens]|uniref:Ornithine cyclodeaminase family protein n=1 Tax=Leptobacterium flavescens TaxID=472055 RepID=A0A6P0UJ53_9FLAO|nr:ornithine cyclodeaminase family protein [Leptobacterium flavescens]NER13007.1 ornithine cyclodeaminase family protein [Leptobacterium flavescens]